MKKKIALSLCLAIAPTLITLLSGLAPSLTPSFLHSFIPSSLIAQIPADGLVAWYPFNGNANDESGNGNNGTVNGATLTADRFGNAQSCYSFNGNSWIEVLNSPSLNSASVSISGWFNSNDLATDFGPGCKAIVGKWWQFPSACDTVYYAFLCVLTKPDLISTLCGATSMYAGNLFTANQAIGTGQWYQFTFIHDSNLGGKIFINGQLVNQNTLAGAICNSTNSLHIGADIVNGDLWRFFNV